MNLTFSFSITSRKYILMGFEKTKSGSSQVEISFHVIENIV